MQEIKHPENAAWRVECAKLLNLKFASFLRDRFFSVEAREGAQVVEVTVLLSNTDESFYYPVLTQIQHSSHSLSAFEAACVLLDFIEAYFAEYFSNDESVYLPIDLSLFRVGDYELMAKGQVHNKFLENIADTWLEQPSLTLH